MGAAIWNLQIFSIALATLFFIFILQEYNYHKNIHFIKFREYTKPFVVFNVVYIICGAFAATILVSLLNPNSSVHAIIYAGSWEGIFGSVYPQRKEEVKNEKLNS